MRFDATVRGAAQCDRVEGRCTDWSGTVVGRGKCLQNLVSPGFKTASPLAMKCFVIMPFHPQFDPVYDVIKQAVLGAKTADPVECRRLDEKKAAGRITEDLLSEIRDSALCIADVTGNNPNVMWELGYATALQKPTLLVSQSGATIPFDLKDLRSILYKRRALSSTLREPLAEAVEHTLSDLEKRIGVVRRIPMAPAAGFTVALTGSMHANHPLVERRLEVVLQPLLSVTTHWLLGSWGDVDAVGLRMLIERRQSITVIGYNAIDISPPMLTLIEQAEVPFIAADAEQLPRDAKAPSARDWLFLSRADLVVLVWDGQSQGTRRLLDWYRKKGKNHLIAFL